MFCNHMYKICSVTSAHKNRPHTNPRKFALKVYEKLIEAIWAVIIGDTLLQRQLRQSVVEFVEVAVENGDASKATSAPTSCGGQGAQKLQRSSKDLIISRKIDDHEGVLGAV